MKTTKTTKKSKIAWVLTDGGVPVAATTLPAIVNLWGKLAKTHNAKAVLLLLTGEDVKSACESE